MASVIARCIDKSLLGGYPRWIKNNIHWEVITGSVAYSMSNDTSDMDIYSWAIPPRNMLFPHLQGHILGFGIAPENFNVFQCHHIQDTEANKEYDITCYNIVSYFNLCMQCNPNMIDSLFVPRRCVLYSTPIGEHMRSYRKLFLHKGAYYKYRGYAHQQMGKIDGRANASNPKRKASIEQFGYDVKFGSHVVRLLLQMEEVLTTGDLTLDRNSEILKSIRRGEWTLERLKEWHAEKERSLETVFANSKLPDKPDEAAIKTILLDCLTYHFGPLTGAVETNKNVEALVGELETVLERYR